MSQNDRFVLTRLCANGSFANEGLSVLAVPSKGAHTQSCRRKNLTRYQPCRTSIPRPFTTRATRLAICPRPLQRSGAGAGRKSAGIGLLSALVAVLMFGGTQECLGADFSHRVRNGLFHQRHNKSPERQPGGIARQRGDVHDRLQWRRCSRTAPCKCRSRRTPAPTSTVSPSPRRPRPPPFRPWVRSELSPAPAPRRFLKPICTRSTGRAA